MWQTFEKALAEIVQVTEDDQGAQGHLIFPSVFQGFPEAAHGGGIVAAFDHVARRGGLDDQSSRRLVARIQRSIPLDHPLSITASRQGDRFGVSLCQGAEPSATAEISSGAVQQDDLGFFGAWSERDGHHWETPVTRGCLACGSENPLGARLRFTFDPQWLWSEHQPREPFRLADGGLDPALFPILLDEVAWWLGALRTGEAGVTTEIAMTLHHPHIAFDERLVLAGERSRVISTDRRGRLWEVSAGLWSTQGRLLASAKVSYAVIRAYTKRLIPALRSMNPPELVARIFPGYS
jgi:hypothetical protein